MQRIKGLLSGKNQQTNAPYLLIMYSRSLRIRVNLTGGLFVMSLKGI